MIDPTAQLPVTRQAKLLAPYLRAYDSVTEAKTSLARYVAFYNERRPHRRLDGQTPDHVYFGRRPLAAAA